MKPVRDTPIQSLLKLSPEQAAFVKKQTGIKNDGHLAAHLLKVQERAYEIFPYPFIKNFTFLQLGIVSQPRYKSIIRLGQERPDGILLNLSCYFGVDARKVVADGFPLKNVVTFDLHKEFFDIGHALFKTTPETYPMGFVAGNMFDAKMLQIVPPLDKPPSAGRPDLSRLTSLNPLAGRCAVIYAPKLFHLFSEENQHHLAKALAGLLSPQPGSMICGEHIGNWRKGVFRRGIAGREMDMFMHCPESWSAVWNDVFQKGKVRVDVMLEEAETVAEPTYPRLQWSVVRL